MKILNDIQGSQDWLDSRLGMLTGTRLSKILTAKKLGLSSSSGMMINTLIDEQITGISADPFISNRAIERGNELEPLARKAYTAKTGNKIIETGLCISDKFPLLGCSPDGWTEDYKGAIEIKCPGVVHLQYLQDKSIPDSYKLQVYNYFLVNEKLEWLDFVSYRPEFYSNPLFMCRVNRSDIEKELAEIDDTLDKFFNKLFEIKTELTF